MAKASSNFGQGWLDQTLNYGQTGGTATATPAPTAAPKTSQWWQTSAPPARASSGGTTISYSQPQGLSSNYMGLAEAPVGTAPPTTNQPPAPQVNETTPPVGVPPKFNPMNGYNPNLTRPQQWWQQNPTAPLRLIASAEDKPFYTPGVPGNHATDFWQQVGQMVAGGNKNFLDFWNANYNRVEAMFWKAAEENKQLQFPDFVTGQIAQMIMDDYESLPPQQRGINSALYDKGRYDTRY